MIGDKFQCWSYAGKIYFNYLSAHFETKSFNIYARANLEILSNKWTHSSCGKLLAHYLSLQPDYSWKFFLKYPVSNILKGNPQCAVLKTSCFHIYSCCLFSTDCTPNFFGFALYILGTPHKSNILLSANFPHWILRTALFLSFST